MTTKPILFLDVDGVLNVFSAKVPSTKTYVPSRWSDEDVINVPVEVADGTTRRIHNLLGHFEPVWATAWLGGAHGGWREILDLPSTSWPHITYFGLKLPEIIRHAGERPWAWIDDDAIWEMRELKWSDRMIGDNLIINPDPRIGLTDEIVDEVIDWARNLGVPRHAECDPVASAKVE